MPALAKRTNCPLYLAHGNCSIPNCLQSHQVRRCSCQAIVPNSQFEEHLRGRRHRQSSKPHPHNGTGANNGGRQPPTASQSSPNIRCDPCQLSFTTFDAFSIHRRTPMHQRAIVTVATDLPTDGRQSNRHGAQDHQPFDPRADYGLEISPSSLDFGVVDSDIALRRPISTHRDIRIIMHQEGRIDLLSIRLRSSVQQHSTPNSSSFSCGLVGRSWVITPGHIRRVSIDFDPRHEGLHEDTLDLSFKDHRNSEEFSVSRRLRAIVGSQEDHALLHSDRPYIRRRREHIPWTGPVFSTTRPPIWTPVKWVRAMGKFEIPKALEKYCLTLRAEGIKGRFMSTDLDLSSYGRNFGVMLHLEEFARKVELEMSSIEGVEFKARHPNYMVPIPSLDEKGIMVGDYIIAKASGEPENTPLFKGRVHKVFMIEKTISVQFGDNFNIFRGAVFDVQLCLNRLPFQRMHSAIMAPDKQPRILFPEPDHIRGGRMLITSSNLPFNPHNSLIEENQEQLQTIATILFQPPGSVPFIIFGPPGTGKTTTIVEAMHQLLERHPDFRILACAPSNSAANKLVLDLNLDPKELLRLNALYLDPAKAPEGLNRYCVLNGNDVYAIPTLESLKQYRVIVCTCISAGVLWGIGVPKGHFSHIIIDEAGQAQEPTAAIPILMMADSKTNVILAGDHQQLGPICNSPVAKELGLSKSYLSRMVERPIYDLQSGRGLTVVKLLKNFRNHPAIIAFSNRMFYDNELITSELHQDTLLESEIVPSHFPVLFHSIVGEERQEANSPSYFNISDASVVKRYCDHLTTHDNVLPEEIGIITPYHTQQIKLKELLGSKFTVGTVEEFQGQERRVIIISTVRSRSQARPLDPNIRHTLGFVADRHRMNVALTRARALLIVVGNPIVLGLDYYWREFLSYVHRNGGWRESPDIPWNSTEIPPESAESDIHAQAEGNILVERLKARIIDPAQQIVSPVLVDL
ncbi:P-loop containing nucleoside triphosphate hydrolase protein [Hygrophoropsis aurantiaca]|uniref:P-loop containing nucleoside triphosphate hydrolase protein n=1 Tax=Hygrophoropsis aurantiaca TaxID=72124 RepID=A0ACB8ACB1_9AGAM|nr:P-loop containing nucleoside triphosphate hydrolase protein [Hygrophoropsis aurantiaca]